MYRTRTPLGRGQELNVVKVTDFNYATINRALTLSYANPVNTMIEVVYRRHPNFNNLILGDLLVIGTKMGKGVEVGEIKKIEKSLDKIVITVQAPEEVPWQEDVIEWIGKSGQELFVDWVNPAHRLGVELSLTRYVPEPDPSHPFASVPNFHKPLDGSGDGTITEPEANDFVTETRRQIDEAGLTFAQLAKKIPPMLKVNKIEVDGLEDGRTITTTYFNGVPAKVQLVGGKSFMYIEQQLQFTGVSTNPYRDVDRIRLEVCLRGLQRVSGWGPRQHPNQSLKYPQEWVTPNQYINVIDKRSESIILNDEKIASIKKVKRYGKCYYKIEMEDSGVVPSIRDGYFKDCILTIKEAEAGYRG